MRPRDWFLCLSLANLCFLRIWAQVQDRNMLYFRKAGPRAGEFEAVLIEVLLLSLVLAAVLRALRAIDRSWAWVAARCGLLVLLMVPLRNLMLQFPVLKFPMRQVMEHAGRAGAIVLLVLAVAAALYWNRQAARAAVALITLMTPLVAFNVANSLSILRSTSGGAYADRVAARLASPRLAGPRVVIVLFDELDYRLTFERRPPGMTFPALDRLRAGSAFALDALPAGPQTSISVPSIVTGREVTEVRSSGASGLFLSGGQSASRWDHVPNIFSEARRSGLRTAVVGWYHPYCRVLGTSLDECYSEQGVSDRPEWAHPIPLIQQIRLQLRRQISAAPFVTLYDDTTDISRPEHKAEYMGIHRRALALAPDRSFGLVYLHYPIPHPPGIFDPVKGEFDMANHHGYADNLPLVDRSLRELRESMELNGAWDASTVILTADHPLRAEMWKGEEERWGPSTPRVPLLIKLPGRERGFEYPREVNNRVLHDLVLDLLAGTVRTGSDLAAWLDAHSGTLAQPKLARRPETDESQ